MSCVVLSCLVVVLNGSTTASLGTHHYHTSAQTSRIGTDQCWAVWYWGVLQLLKEKHISVTVPTIMYKSILRPLLVYGCECWVLTIKLKRNQLRWYGPGSKAYQMREHTHTHTHT